MENKEILENVITPCFILDKKKIDEAILLLENSLKRNWNNYIIGYSFKTNSLPWLLEYMKDVGVYAEVVSDDEFNLADRIGFDNNKVIYNGPIKSKETFMRALSNRCIVNIDSNRELSWLIENGECCEIGIRVNFDIERLCPKQSACGSEGGRFGFCYENGELGKLIEKIKQVNYINIVGLHMHCSSKTRSIEVYKAIAQMSITIADEFNLNLKYIDIGGGFFGGLVNKPTFNEYFIAVSGILKKKFNPDRLTLICEPGMSVIGANVSYVTEVIDVKNTNYNTFVVTNGSRIHIDPFMKKSTYGYFLETNSVEKCRKQVIAGFTCIENDRIMVLENEKSLVTGDKIVYDKVGAYTMALSPLFIQYFPNVYVLDNSKYYLVRNKWGIDEYIQKSMDLER